MARRGSSKRCTKCGRVTRTTSRLCGAVVQGVFRYAVCGGRLEKLPEERVPERVRLERDLAHVQRRLEWWVRESVAVSRNLAKWAGQAHRLREQLKRTDAQLEAARTARQEAARKGRAKPRRAMRLA